MEKEWKYIGYLLTIYIVAIPLNGFMMLPFVGDKIQLPEIVFLVLATVTFFKVLKYKSWLKWQVTKIDKALIIYGLALLISCIGHLTRVSFFEMLGFAYLLVLYSIINFYFIESGVNIRALLVKKTEWSGVFTGLFGIAGLLILAFGVATILVQYYVNYPILGSIYRVKALSTEPIMLISNLSVFALVSFANVLSSRKSLFSWGNMSFFALLGTVMFFTYTKSIVMFVASASVMVSIQYNIFQPFKKATWSFILIIFLFLSHFSFVSKTDFEQDKFCNALEKKPLMEIGEKYLLRTCYGVLKESTMIAFSRHPLIGLGGGNFTEFTNVLKKENLYPSYLVEFDPLSTYFGALSELGLIGFLSLLFLYYSVYEAWKNMSIDTHLTYEDRQFWLLMGAVLLFIIAEGFVTDTMNFRHYWLVLACLTAQHRIVPTNKIVVN